MSKSSNNPQWKHDYAVKCANCGAEKGKPCKGPDIKRAGMVHFARRLKSLLNSAHARQAAKRSL